MDAFSRDLRHAFRRIRRSPGFCLIAVLSISLGVGANAAIFTIIDELLLQEAPYRDPEELVHLYPTSKGEVEFNSFSYPELKDVEERTGEVFAGVTSTSIELAQESTPDGSRALTAEVVRGNYFSLLGVKMALGRGFEPEEYQAPETTAVVVLSYPFWQRRFGGDPEAVGQNLRLSRRPYLIVGVASEEMPTMVPGLTPDVWVPSMMLNELSQADHNRLESRGSHNLQVMARLRRGVTLAQAHAALDRVVEYTHQTYPAYRDDWGLTARYVSDVAVHPWLDNFLFPAAAVLMGVVGLVLLIACVNLTSFLLARAADRRKEVALRLALGARRATLIRQLLTETALLGIGGGLIGYLLALLLLRLVAQVQLPGPVPIDLSMAPDTGVFLFGIGLSLAAGLFFGLTPALQSTRVDLAPTLKDEAATGRRPGFFNLRNLLVVAQVAVSVLLLVSSGLFLRSLQAASSVDPGFGNGPTAIVWVGISSRQFDLEAREQFFRRLKEEVENLPGVESVGLVDNLALSGISFNHRTINVPGMAPPPGTDGHSIDMVIVDPGYFETLAVDLIAGRNFSVEDRRDATQVAIVSRAMAEKFWPNQEAVGQVMTTPSGTEYRVVGVAEDTNVVRLGENPIPYLYFPLTQNDRDNLQIVARTAFDPRAAADAIARVAVDLNRDAIIIEKEALEEHFGFMLFPFRVGGLLLAVFGGLTILLAGIGLYGIVSYSAASRTREVSIRMSLGARAGKVMSLVMRGGMALVFAGTAIGVLLALLAAPVMNSLLFGVSGTDLMAFAGTVALMAGLGFLGTFFPALRATRVDPLRALRTE